MGNDGFFPDAWFVEVDSYNTSYYSFFYFDVSNSSASAWGGLQPQPFVSAE